MQRNVIKLKESEPVPVPMPVSLATPVTVKKKTVLIFKKPLPVAKPVAEPVAKPVAEPEPVTIQEPVQVKKKTVLRFKKLVVVPPPPAPGVYVTKAMEAFEAIRDYCLLNKKSISEEDVKWYQEELLQEKKEFDEFWERCAETKVNMECVLRGDDDWTTDLAINAARQKVKTLPIQEGDIGPMPEYGTKDFWSWCHKRKKLKEQKEAAIIAAGGKVKEKKPKKVRPA